MNTIHSRYQKAGKISNDDLLYTLSVFITGKFHLGSRNQNTHA